MKLQWVIGNILWILIAAAPVAHAAQPATAPLCTWVDKTEIKSLLGGDFVLHKRSERRNVVECTWVVAHQALTLTSAATPDISKLPPPASGMAHTRGPDSPGCTQNVLILRSNAEAQALHYPMDYQNRAYPGGLSLSSGAYYTSSDGYNPFGFESCASISTRPNGALRPADPPSAPDPPSQAAVNAQQTLQSSPSNTAPEDHSNAVIAKMVTAQNRKLTLVFVNYLTVTAEQESAVRGLASRLIEKY